MKYTDEQKERIRHCFDYYCKKTIRYQAITLYRESSKYAERNVSFEDIPNDYFSEYGECDTYPILQYHFEAFGYNFLSMTTNWETHYCICQRKTAM